VPLSFQIGLNSKKEEKKNKKKEAPPNKKKTNFFNVLKKFLEKSTISKHKNIQMYKSMF
jgi:hypothetical protein